MNWNELEGQWNQVEAPVRQKYSKLTGDDLRAIAGKKEPFIAKLQERYGMSREQAQKDLEAFIQGLRVTQAQRAHGSGGAEY